MIESMIESLIATCGVSTLKSVDVVMPSVKENTRIWVGSRLAVPAKNGKFDIAAVIKLEHDGIIIRRDRNSVNERIRIVGGAIAVDIYPIVFLTQQRPGNGYDLDELEAFFTSYNPIKAVVQSKKMHAYDEYSLFILLHAISNLAFGGIVRGIKVQIDGEKLKRSRAYGLAGYNRENESGLVRIIPRYIHIRSGLSGRLLAFTLAHEACHIADFIENWGGLLTPEQLQEFGKFQGHGPSFMSFRKNLAPYSIPLVRYVVTSVSDEQDLEIGLGSEHILLVAPVDKMLYAGYVFKMDEYGKAKALSARSELIAEQHCATAMFSVKSNNLLTVLSLRLGEMGLIEGRTVEMLRRQSNDVVTTEGGSYVLPPTAAGGVDGYYVQE